MLRKFLKSNGFTFYSSESRSYPGIWNFIHHPFQETKLLSLIFELPYLESLFVFSHSCIDVVLAEFEHSVNQPGSCS